MAATFLRTSGCNMQHCCHGADFFLLLRAQSQTDMQQPCSLQPRPDELLQHCNGSCEQAMRQCTVQWAQRHVSRCRPGARYAYGAMRQGTCSAGPGTSLPEQPGGFLCMTQRHVMACRVHQAWQLASRCGPGTR